MIIPPRELQKILALPRDQGRQAIVFTVFTGGAVPFIMRRSRFTGCDSVNAFFQVYGSQGGENVCLNQTDKQRYGDPDHRYKPWAEEIQDFQQNFACENVAE